MQQSLEVCLYGALQSTASNKPQIIHRSTPKNPSNHAPHPIYIAPKQYTHTYIQASLRIKKRWRARIARWEDIKLALFVHRYRLPALSPSQSILKACRTRSFSIGSPAWPGEIKKLPQVLHTYTYTHSSRI